VSDLVGSRVLVTGASSGIGAGLAVGFAQAGCTVALAARREDRLAQVLATCRETSPGSEMWVTDLEDPAQVEALIPAVTDAFGGIDVLVNCAGIPKRRHITKLDLATVERVMNINFFAPARLMLAVLPQMAERGRGLVVNVSSIAATLSSPREAAYDASKSALSVFSESAAIDLWGSGIRIMVVYPGLVDTELFSVPDNDPVIDAVEPIPVSEVVDAVFKGIDEGAAQVYVPDWFEKIAADKAANVGGFLAGSAAFLSARGS
jgi:short-subunit dehydrogenase